VIETAWPVPVIARIGNPGCGFNVLGVAEVFQESESEVWACAVIARRRMRASELAFRLFID
jgi:hypothetical protein